MLTELSLFERLASLSKKLISFRLTFTTSSDRFFSEKDDEEVDDCVLELYFVSAFFASLNALLPCFPGAFDSDSRI